MKSNPEASQDRAIFEGGRFLRAPVVVGVISSPVDCKRATPIWEQQLSSGIVCYNLMIAAQAAGYGAQWLTEWYGYDSDIHAVLGMGAGDQVAGFVYIGTALERSKERVRPDMATKISYW